jgi:hypothetical protein
MVDYYFILLDTVAGQVQINSEYFYLDSGFVMFHVEAKMEKRGEFAPVLKRGKFAPKFPAKKNTYKKRGKFSRWQKKYSLWTQP